MFPFFPPGKKSDRGKEGKINPIFDGICRARFINPPVSAGGSDSHLFSSLEGSVRQLADEGCYRIID